MGAGASAGITAAIKESSDDDMKAVFGSMGAADRERLIAILDGPRPNVKFMVTVSEVPPPPTGEALEKFKSQYLNNDEFPDERRSERVKDEDEVRVLQFKRLEWARDNVHTYISMLRLSGHKDSYIQAMCDGACPLGADPECMSTFCAGLPSFAEKLEKELGWKGARFVQTGSSILGYSQNPMKGFANQPSKITNMSSSDVDICIVAEGAPAYYEQLEKDGKEVWRMPTHLEDGQGLRFGVANSDDNPSIIRDWCEKWKSTFPGGLQVTVQQELDPKLPLWESWIS